MTLTATIYIERGGEEQAVRVSGHYAPPEPEFGYSAEWTVEDTSGVDLTADETQMAIEELAEEMFRRSEAVSQ